MTKDIRIVTVSAGYIGNGKPSTGKFVSENTARQQWADIVADRNFYAFAALYIDGKCVNYILSAGLRSMQPS